MVTLDNVLHLIFRSRFLVLATAIAAVAPMSLGQNRGGSGAKPRISFVVYPGEATVGAKVQVVWKAESVASPKWRVALEWSGKSLDVASSRNVVADGPNKWRADFSVPVNMPTGNQYRIVVRDDATGAQGATPPISISGGDELVIEGRISPARAKTSPVTTDRWDVEVRLTYLFRDPLGRDPRHNTRLVFKTYNVRADDSGRFEFRASPVTDLAEARYEVVVRGASGHRDAIQAVPAFPGKKHALAFQMQEKR